MPSWFSPLWDFLKDPDNRTVIAWLGGGIVTVVGGAWAALKFFAERKKAADKKGGDTTVIVGQGSGSARDTTYQGPVSFGPSPEQIEQIQKPLVEQIAVLTKALLERNPVATPGAQQAVGAAVGSIVEGAAEGDSRLQKALDLLRENKIAEASQLLTAFAGDKEARAERATQQAEKDRKEAATAYRNLGAIAGLADPKRALGAYEKALALDTDDVESLFWAGYIQIDYGDLNKAQTRLERVLKLAESGDKAFYKYAAAGSLGEVKQLRGDLSGALLSYRDTIPIIDRLAKSDPGNAGWQRDLSVAFNKIGGVQEAQGNLAGALKSYSDGLAISDRLAKSDPGNAGWQRDLSVSYDNIGGVQQAQGELAGALKSYEDSLAIRDRLAKSDPGNAGWQRDLAVSYNKIGDAQVVLDGALESYSDSLAIAEHLAQSDPGNAGWQRDLSVSFGKLASAYAASGDKAKALDFLQQSQAIMARLTKLSPENATWKGDLARFGRDLAALAER